jgi:hypothetical protein
MNYKSMTSDQIANLSVGVQNIYIRDKNGDQINYTPKNEWERHRDDMDANHTFDDDDIHDWRLDRSFLIEYFYDRTIEIHPQFKNQYGTYFKLKNHVCIKNVRLRIKLSDLNMNLSEILNGNRHNNSMESSISFFDRDQQVHSITMSINLFFAYILDRKIVEDDDYIYIPIVIFDLILCKNLELHGYNIGINIHISNKHNISDLTLLYDNYEPTDYNSINENLRGREHYMYQSQFSGTEYVEYDRPLKMNHSHPCAFIIFMFNEEIELNKVKLSLNGFPPIEWCKENDEIMRTTIYGNTMYGISLIPDIKKFKDIQKSFKHSKPSGCGINFSRIDETLLYFEYEGNDKLVVSITFMGINILRTMSQVMGLAYAN